MRPLICACLLALPCATAAETRFAPEAAAILQAGLTTTADSFILPAYAAQADAAGRLAAALDGYCAGGAEGTGDPAPVTAAFADLFLAWQRAGVVQFGPITDAEGPMRVQLWPDPKGFARRAIRGAVQAQDPALLAEGGLEGRSIALSNLTALELLVHGDALVPESYACDLAHAIARFQEGLAQDMVAAWTPGSPYRADYDSAAAGNATYPTVDALIRDLLAGTVVYVDRLRKFRFDQGLGSAPGEARAERTEARLSGLGLQSIAASFRALADLYETPYGLFDSAPDIGGSMDYYVLGETAESVADALALEPASLVEIAEADGPRAADLRGYATLLGYDESFLKTGFAQSIGMTIGFTAADGD